MSSTTRVLLHCPHSCCLLLLRDQIKRQCWKIGRHYSEVGGRVGAVSASGRNRRCFGAMSASGDVGLRLTQHRHCLRLQSSVGLLLNTVSHFGLVRAVNNKSGRHCTNTLVIDSTYLYYVFGLRIMKTIMSLNRWLLNLDCQAANWVRIAATAFGYRTMCLSRIQACKATRKRREKNRFRVAVANTASMEL